MTKTEVLEVEIDAAADRLWKAYWDLKRLGPKLLPQVILSAEWIQGNGEVGSIREIRFQPDAHEAPIPVDSSKDVIDYVDRDNYTFTYHTSGGPLVKLYSSYKVTTQLVPISSGTTLVKHTIEFEPIGNCRPPVPHTRSFLGFSKALEAYLTANEDEYA